MAVLDDVGKKITADTRAEPEWQRKRGVAQAGVIMAIVAPNGNCCRVFRRWDDNCNPVPGNQWNNRADTVRAFMENHVDVPQNRG